MKRILLIDDENETRHIWQRFHELTEPVFRGSLEMDLASTLEQGLARMKGVEYDVVILDLALPPLKPSEVISWIFENSPTAPIIAVLTNDADIQVRIRCLQAGAACFWFKPDAIARPDLFFKGLYNEFIKRHAR